MSDVITGARVRFMLKGVKVGHATDWTCRESIRYEPLETLDNIEVDEHVPVGYYVDLSCRRAIIRKEDLKKSGWFPKTGTTSEKHLQEILLTGELEAVLLDSNNGEGLIIVTGVKIADHNWTITARGIAMEDVTFTAIRRKDESEI